MMNFSKKKLAIACALLFSPAALYAEPFCDGYTDVTGGGGTYISETIGPNKCIEIGAGIDNGIPYNGHGEDLTIEGAVSVTGTLSNSTVKSGALFEVSKNNAINADGYIDHAKATATNITIEEGAQTVRVSDGGQLIDSTTYADVWIGGGLNAPSYSKNLTVNGASNGKEVKELVYINGESDGSTIKSGALQQVQQGGKSSNATIESGAEQIIWNEGKSYNATIEQGGTQFVQTQGSYGIGTTLNGGTQTVSSAGAVHETTINDGGRQNVMSANSQAHDTIINANGEQHVYSQAEVFNTTINDGGYQSIKNGGTTTNTTIKGGVSALNYGGKALGETIISDAGQMHLNTNNGQSGYAENVKLTDDASALIVFNNDGISATATVGTLSGNAGRVLFYNPQTYDQIQIDNLSGSLKFQMHTNIQGKLGNYITINQGSGNHSLILMDSGSEITEANTPLLDLVSDNSGGANFDLESLTGAKITAIDGGVYQFYLRDREDEAGTGKIWYLTTDATPAPDPEPTPDPEPKPQPPVSQPVMTPSAEAVLHLASAPQIIFNNQLDNLRFRRGIVQNNGDNAGVWGRIFTDKTKVHPFEGKFTLEQNTLELGFDKYFTADNGSFLVGGFIDYSDNSLKHNRGGKSGFDSYGFGIYGTYFINNGIYLDGVVKYNRYKAELDTRSTNGQLVSGKYHQNGIGLALEIGRNFSFENSAFIEPYARLSYAAFNGKSFTLNNGMHANIEGQKSFIGEVGVNVGKSFRYEDTVFHPYLKVALGHEFSNKSDVVLNHRHRFTNDFTGTIQKYGVGLDIQFSKKGQFFTEINYRKGKHTESDYSLNLGFEYKF